MKKPFVSRLVYLAMSTLLTLSISVFADDQSSVLDREGRSDRDRAVDEFRKPIEVLEFIGVAPGMSVFDVFAGGGYYTEILSYLVGPQGYVVHYNNRPWAAFVKKATEARFKDNRLPNVEQLVAPPESLAAHVPEFDVALFVLGMHDIYYADPDTGWVAIDAERFTQGMFDLLKPGGVLGVIDHNANSGTDPADVGERLHRVDPAQLIKDLEAVGFVLEAQSDILRNPDDDKSTNVFLPENRFKTDRSLLRFRKP